MSKKSKTDINSLYKTIRGSWNGINPVSKIIPDKRRKPDKYKKKQKGI